VDPLPGLEGMDPLGDWQYARFLLPLLSESKLLVTNPYPDARRGLSIVPGIGTSVGSEEGVRVAYTRVFEVQVQGNRARPAGSRWRQTTWARPELRVRRRAGGEV